MKHIYNIIICFIWYSLFYLLGTSCQENGDIGDLYGQWQLTSIQNDSEIKHPKNSFLAFQNDCIFARITGTDAHYTYQVTGGFLHEGQKLKLSFYIDAEKEGAEIMHQYMTSEFGFPLPHTDIQFEIEKLDSSELILKNGNNYWQFRSY